MNILVTGSAGFIGFHMSLLLLKKGHKVIGLDNLNDYYDVNLKKNRLKILKRYKNFTFYKKNISNKKEFFKVFKNIKISIIIHLSAQPGIRYSITNPDAYFESNILGFYNILELCRQKQISSLYFASTSSVYGDHNSLPFNENQNITRPLQFYSASKIANEVMAYSYSSLYSIKCIGLRFFTVYGPFGRPDMAIYSFVKDIFQGNKIQVYNKGNHTRDFTYIDDIVISIHKLIIKNKKLKNNNYFEVFNIGNQENINILKMIKIIENIAKKKANIQLVKKAVGDMNDTYSNSNKLHKYINFKPSVSLDVGLKKFIDWYKTYYNIL